MDLTFSMSKEAAPAPPTQIAGTTFALRVFSPALSAFLGVMGEKKIVGILPNQYVHVLDLVSHYHGVCSETKLAHSLLHAQLLIRSNSV